MKVFRKTRLGIASIMLASTGAVLASTAPAHAATTVPMVSSPSAAINKAGNAEVFARGADGQIWHAWNRGGTNWSGWAALPGRTDAAGNPGVGRLPDGRLIVFTRTTGGALVHINQYADGSWTPWTAESLNVAGDPVVGHDQDGRIEAFWRDSANHLVHLWQISGGTWSDPTALLNSSVVGNPSVDNDKDGRIEVFVTVQVSGQKNVLRLAQTSPNHSFGPNSTMLPNVTAMPTVTHNGDGRLEYFARGTGGTIYHSVETAVNATTWSKPANLVVGGKATPIDDHVVGAVSGTKKHLEVFYRQPNGQLGHQWHTAPTGNAWHVGIAMPSTSVTVGTTPSVATNGGTLTVFWNDGFTVKHNELVGDTWRTPTAINNPTVADPPAQCVSPFQGNEQNLIPQRIDQGVDYGFRANTPVKAICDGVVISTAGDSSWDGVFIVYKLSTGPWAGKCVFVAEHLSNVIAVGTHVTAGQTLAIATPAPPSDPNWGIETGWAQGPGAPATPYPPNADHNVPTEGGLAFARYLRTFGVPTVSDPGPGPQYAGNSCA